MWIRGEVIRWVKRVTNYLKMCSVGCMDEFIDLTSLISVSQSVSQPAGDGIGMVKRTVAEGQARLESSESATPPPPPPRPWFSVVTDREDEEFGAYKLRRRMRWRWRRWRKKKESEREEGPNEFLIPLSGTSQSDQYHQTRNDLSSIIT